jgi:hypothetical protein
MNVLAEMERHPAAPWEVRDRMLRQIKWHEPIPWSTKSDPAGHRGPIGDIDPEIGIRPISEWGAECGRDLFRAFGNTRTMSSCRSGRCAKSSS